MEEVLKHTYPEYFWCGHGPPENAACCGGHASTASVERKRGGRMPQGPGYLALPTIDSVGSVDSPGGNKDQPPRVVSLQQLGRPSVFSVPEALTTLRPVGCTLDAPGCTLDAPGWSETGADIGYVLLPYSGWRN